ncbi:MAG: radical SAM protein [Ruminococcus sp.]|nr:radical SAM protein [Ruminococcus sp.]
MICNLCPRQCNAARGENDGKGFCGLGVLPKIARVAPHYWEEPCISGTKGSGAVFFSGCTLRCVFCQNYEISAERKGKYITPIQLADEIKKLESSGVHNINLVSPAPYVEAIKSALDIYKPKIPVVYNCSGYESVETLRGLEGYVDIYLPDFKYSDNALAEKFSSAKNYVETALRAIGEMLRQTGEPEYDGNNMMTKGTIIRHLVLPNHTKNSIEALGLIAGNFDNPLVSLMCQYIPFGRAREMPKLNRKITKREYEKVTQTLFELNLDGFVQDLSSADEKYIPTWDY